MSEGGKKLIRNIAVTPTIDTAIFAAGDAMHTSAINLTNFFGEKRTGKIIGVSLTDAAKIKGVITLHFFSSDPSASTIIANAALVVPAADLPKHVGHVNIAAADYEDFSASAEASVQVNVPVSGNTANRSLYMVMKVKSGTPDYVAATDIRLNIHVEQD